MPSSSSTCSNNSNGTNNSNGSNMATAGSSSPAPNGNSTAAAAVSGNTNNSSSGGMSLGGLGSLKGNPGNNNHEPGLVFLAPLSNVYGRWLQVQCLKAKPVSEGDFTQFRVLGRGGFGLVYGCMRKTTGHLYAMKTMDRRRVKMKKAGDLCWNERIILGRINSPFIVCLKYAFISKTELFLVMDLMLGGDLSFWLSKKKRFSRDETKYHAGRIFLALRHMHRHRIVYRCVHLPVVAVYSSFICLFHLSYFCPILE